MNEKSLEEKLKNNFHNYQAKINFAEIYSKINLSLNNKKLSKRADNVTLVEVEDFEKGKRECELDRLKTEVDGLKKLLKWRTYLTCAIFISVQLWMGAVFYIIFWQGHLHSADRLDYKITIALLSSVGVDIIGLLYLLIKYVLDPKFYTNSKNNNK